MKLAAMSAFGLLLAASAWAQRGVAGGGVAHSTGRTFSAPSGGSLRNFGSASSIRSNSSFPLQRPSQYNSPIGPPPLGASYPYDARRNHGTGSYPYGSRPYYSRGGYVLPGWIGPGFYGYGYGYADDSASADQQNGDQQGAATLAPDAGPQQVAPQAPPEEGYQQAYAPPPARPPYQPEQPLPPAAVAELPEQPELTLFFKDGRPTQQVRNYAVTPTTLYVLDGARRRDIPLDQIDLPQTEKTNREAGLDFAVPAAE